MNQPTDRPTDRRTLDPEEADFFYVPHYGNCLFDVYGKNDIPRYPSDVHGARSPAY